MKWSFSQIWNESLEQREDRPLTPRQHCWAGELGGSLIDRWFKMKAEPYSNPPNPRSLRKFEAGNIWEWIIALVLKRAGILRARNEWVAYQYPDLLKVTGKLDFLAGGKPDWEKAQAGIMTLDLPAFISKATHNLIEHFRLKYPDGMAEIILELKSCAGVMYDQYEAKQSANPHHKLQLFHYLKAKDIEEGHIVYISKDDARLLEIGVLNPSPIEEAYKKDIEAMTGYIQNNEQPPLEKHIVWNKDFGKFSVNWKVGYSVYLTKLYGFKDQMTFDEKYKPTVERWNRVIGRINQGKELTDNNKQALEEIQKEFPDWKAEGVA